MAYDNKNLRKLQNDLLQWANTMDMQSILKLKDVSPSGFRDLCQSRILRKFWTYVVANVENAELLEKENLLHQLQTVKSKNEHLREQINLQRNELHKEQEEIKKIEMKICQQEKQLCQQELECVSAHRQTFVSRQKNAIHDSYSRKISLKSDELRTTSSVLSSPPPSSSFQSFEETSAQMKQVLASTVASFDNFSAAGGQSDKFWDYITTEDSGDGGLCLSHPVVPTVLQRLCKQEVENIIKKDSNPFNKDTCTSDSDDTATQNLLLSNAQTSLQSLKKVSQLDSDSSKGVQLIQSQLLPQCSQKLEQQDDLRNAMDLTGSHAALEYLTNKIVSLSSEISSNPESSYKHLVTEIRSLDEASHANRQKLLQLISSNNTLLKNGFILDEFCKVETLQREKSAACHNLASCLHRDFRKNFNLEHKLFKELDIMNAAKFTADIDNDRKLTMQNLSVNAYLCSTSEYAALTQVFDLSCFSYPSDILKCIYSTKSAFFESHQINTVRLFDISNDVSKTLSYLLKKDESYNSAAQVFHSAEIEKFKQTKDEFEITLYEWMNQPVATDIISVHS